VAPARPLPTALAALLLAGCAGGAATSRGAPDLSLYDLQARLAARAASMVGQAGDFRVGGERFAADCTGFVEAVYEAEGVPLRALMRRAAASGKRTGVDAAWRAASAYGAVLGRGDWPAPGDLVFWHDTWDRNGNGRTDDGLTHVGVVQWVEDGTVVFVHRGGKTVARGAMDTRRPAESSADGRVVNSPLRRRDPRLEGVPVLAGALFAGYGRIDPTKVPRREVASR
jgi:probable lipoprotein NlpC